MKSKIRKVEATSCNAYEADVGSAKWTREIERNSFFVFCFSSLSAFQRGVVKGSQPSLVHALVQHFH
jgi:hypothetical protein